MPSRRREWVRHSRLPAICRWPAPVHWWSGRFPDEYSSRDQSEKPFDLIEPGSAGGGEMEMEPSALLRLQPPLYLGTLMGAVIIHDEMHVLASRKLCFEVVEETDKFPAAMPVLTGADDFAIEDIERGEQSRGAMTFIVVRLALRQARSQRKDRCGAVQGLDLTLLVHAQYQGTFGRVEIEAHYIADLFLKMRIVGQFELLHTMRLHIVTLPDPVNDGSGDP
jgi:hypothetical protein